MHGPVEGDVGHGLVVGPVDLVPLDIQLSVCVDTGYQRGHVLAALLAAFGTGTAPDGSPAFFSPAVLGFGDPVRVSRMVAVAAAITGVLSAQVTRLRRLSGPDGGELAAGLLRLGPPEIAALIVLKLALAIALARLSRLRALGMVLLGLWLTVIGLDRITGQLRLTFGVEALIDGIDEIVVLLGLFAIVLWRTWRAARLSSDFFGTLVCVGIFAMLAFQTFENVGMTLGIMPVTGIPLPFVSYGGSSLITSFACIGLVLNVSMRRFS